MILYFSNASGVFFFKWFLYAEFYQLIDLIKAEEIQGFRTSE